MPGPPDREWLDHTLDDATDVERAALRAWTGPRYRDLQAALRGGTPMTSELEDLVAAIDGALARSPLPADATAIRRTSPQALGIARREDVEQLVGAIIAQPGYLATTVAARAPALRDSPILMEIAVPVGTPAAYIAPASVIPRQHELLLARGLEMRIIAAGYDRRLQRWVVAAQIA